MTLSAKIGGFTDFFREIGLRKFISFTRRRHRRQRHTRLWPMRIMVPMGRVQVICDFRNYNYWTGNAIDFLASRELCSNFLFNKVKYDFDKKYRTRLWGNSTLIVLHCFCLVVSYVLQLFVALRVCFFFFATSCFTVVSICIWQTRVE